jgi:hypothetical protein
MAQRQLLIPSWPWRATGLSSPCLKGRGSQPELFARPRGTTKLLSGALEMLLLDSRSSDLQDDTAAGADVAAIPAPVVTTMEGTQYTVTHCPDCGARLRAEVRDGWLSLWHAGDGAGAN